MREAVNEEYMKMLSEDYEYDIIKLPRRDTGVIKPTK